jgi:hypothetical protein
MGTKSTIGSLMQLFAARESEGRCPFDYITPEDEARVQAARAKREAEAAALKKKRKAKKTYKRRTKRK